MTSLVPPVRPRRVACALAVALTVAAAAAAGAHAFLEHAEPRVGAAVRAAPPVLRLWFSAPLEPAWSRVEVRDAAGARVDRGDAAVDPGDPTLLRVSLPALGPGRYRVRWRVLSVDTHVTEGDFEFRVKP